MKTPAIFIHGKKDKIVPYYHSKKLHEVFINCIFETKLQQALKVKKELITLDLDHNDPRPIGAKFKVC